MFFKRLEIACNTKHVPDNLIAKTFISFRITHMMTWVKTKHRLIARALAFQTLRFKKETVAHKHTNKHT